MASIVNDPNGRRRILFMGADGRRRAVRLGKVDRKNAEGFCRRVEKIVASQIAGGTVDDETSRWTAELDEVMHARLASVGLVQPRHAMLLRGWVEKHIADRRDLKPASVKKLEQTKAKLLGFFGEGTSLRAITPAQAADWRQHLANQGMSEATVRQHCRNVKALFNEAVRRELVAVNPFRSLRSASIASGNERYVTADEAALILDHCPDQQWRLLFALARYAGLRTPSETHLLTWADVDWDRGRLTVRSPKTERHAGKEQRQVPITGKLMPILQSAFDAAPEGTERVVTRSRHGLAKAMIGIIKKAGLARWPDLFQTLRRSCEVEWAQQFPQFAVSQWIGHSIVVSGKHYANRVPDELFARAATGVPAATREAAQNPAQQAAERGRSASQAGIVLANPPIVTVAGCEGLRDDAYGSAGIRTQNQGIMSPLL
jgi:integrase